MPRAGHRAIHDMAPRQRCPHVGAKVIDGVVLPLLQEDRHHASLNRKRSSFPLGNRANLSNRHKLRQNRSSFPSNAARLAQQTGACVTIFSHQNLYVTTLATQLTRGGYPQQQGPTPHQHPPSTGKPLERVRPAKQLSVFHSVPFFTRFRFSLGSMPWPGGGGKGSARGTIPPLGFVAY